MLAKPKKISRKKVKEDKLVTYYSKTLEFYEKNQTKIIIAVGALAVIILAMVLWSNKMEQSNLEATKQLARVLPIYESGNYQEAIDGRAGTNIVGLKSIVEEYGSTAQGEIAKIYLANANYYLDNIDEAQKYYSDYSGGDALFKAAALAGEASCYSAKGNYDKAAEYYKRAAKVSENNAANAEYLLKAGINFIEAGKSDDAKDVLEKIKSDYAASSFVTNANRYLALIK
ncbi:MAG: tetratricopeptide repeat protein [Ignavibacteriae bacterium]|nr:tetratricopeptide repeat protein [Ignavibacteriota bacterium]NOG96702.1 tetratricopeptide repeat protein [Ignavibacteriota bacterium]